MEILSSNSERVHSRALWQSVFQSKEKRRSYNIASVLSGYSRVNSQSQNILDRKNSIQNNHYSFKTFYQVMYSKAQKLAQLSELKHENLCVHSPTLLHPHSSRDSSSSENALSAPLRSLESSSIFKPLSLFPQLLLNS